MKSIFILFVYGVACCLAMPKCTTDETMKCASLIPFKFEENDEFPIVDINEEFMDKYCDFLLCMNNLLDRCGLPVPEMLMGPVSAMGKLPKFPFDNKKQIKETYEKFCPKTSPLRKKFIANGNCIFKASIEVATSDCMGIIPNSENMTDSCGPYIKFRKCVQDVIERRCGEEAREVIDEMGPSIEDTGCSE